MIPIKLTKPSELEVIQAQKYSEYTVRTNYCVQTHVGYEDENRVYGSLSVVPQDKEFILNVFNGATESDVLRLNQYVQKIRDGYWSSIPFRNVVGKVSGKRFYSVILASSNPAEGAKIFPCTEELCEEFRKFHLLPAPEFADGPIHTGEQISHKKYRLQLIKEHGKKWCIDTEVYQELSVKDAASLASDISWLISEAKKGNGVS